MPRSGPGPATGLPPTDHATSLGVSKPAMIRSSVDLPQPDAPIRQTKLPASITEIRAAQGVDHARRANEALGRSPRDLRIISAMLRAPAQQPAAEQHDRLIGEEARDADGDHADDDDLGARKLARVHDHGA